MGWALGILAAVSSANSSPFTVVDVIPTALSTEEKQNSEPSIAVNPNSPQQVLIGAFDITGPPLPPASQPYFFTDSLDWTIWTRVTSLLHVDGSLAWSVTNNIYAGILSPALDTEVWRSGPPPIAFSQTTQQGQSFDQPRTRTVTIGGHDHVYIGDDNFNGNNSATVFFSVNAEAGSGAIWKSVTIERADPPSPDGSPVRVAPARDGTTVYAAFERPLVNKDAADYLAQIVVVRDDHAGLGIGPGTEFTALGATGSVITSRIVPFFTTSLGMERLGSDLSIGIDPNDPKTVYVAFAQISGGAPVVAIARSTDGGLTWPDLVFLEPNTALPQIAVSNGELGILYTEFKGGMLRTHFDIVDIRDFLHNFGTRADYVLAQFPNGFPAPLLPPNSVPYIGDFEDLIAIGDDFYGTFSASNDPKLADFPQGVYYDRLLNGDMGPGPHGLLLLNTTLLDDVAISIDPFFFAFAIQRFAMPEPPSWPLLLLGLTAMALCRFRVRDREKSCSGPRSHQ